MKHSNTAVVTASIDSVDFLSSARVGDVLELEAIVTSTGIYTQTRGLVKLILHPLILTQI